MRENVTELIALKVHIDNFIWWDVSQEMHFSYSPNTTTTLVWFSKYHRFNIGQCSQHQLFLICSASCVFHMHNQLMHGQQERGNCSLLCLRIQVHTILHITISWSVVPCTHVMVSNTLCACARFYW